MMGNVKKRRQARRKLKAHDRGENRHAKGVAELQRQIRLREEHWAQRRDAKKAAS